MPDYKQNNCLQAIYITHFIYYIYMSPLERQSSSYWLFTLCTFELWINDLQSESLLLQRGQQRQSCKPVEQGAHYPAKSPFLNGVYIPSEQPWVEWWLAESHNLKTPFQYLNPDQLSPEPFSESINIFCTPIVNKIPSISTSFLHFRFSEVKKALVHLLYPLVLFEWQYILGASTVE